MMRLLRRTSTSPALILGSVLGATLLQAGTAEAGRIRFSGSARFSGHVRAGVSVRFARPVVRPVWRPWRPRVWVGGPVWVGSYYYARPYSYYYYPYPEYTPSYSYTPVEATAAPGAVAVAAPRPALPTFGFGVFAGSTNIQDKSGETAELGLLGRIRLTPGLLIEAEVGKDTLKGDVAGCPSGVSRCDYVASGQRIDRRIGGSLIWEIGPENSLAPYLLVGGGVQQAKVSSGDFFGSDFTTTQDFGEVGAGLRLALSHNFHLTADIRAGRRKTIDSDQSGDVTVLARTINPPSGSANDDTEDYTRGRIAAVLNF